MIGSYKGSPDLARNTVSPHLLFISPSHLQEAAAMFKDKATIQTQESIAHQDAITAVPAVGPDTDDVELEDLKPPVVAPRWEDQMDALGIPNWRELEKKLVRRLDFTLMPCLWCLYIINYLDRASIAQARVDTLEEDLNLTGSQYSTAVSILSYG